MFKQCCEQAGCLLVSATVLAACGASPQPSNEVVGTDTAPLTGYLHLPSGPIEVPYVVVDGEAVHGDIDLGRAEDVAREWNLAKQTGKVPTLAGAMSDAQEPRVPWSPALRPEGFDIDPLSGASLLWPGGVICYQLSAAIDATAFQNAAAAWQNWWPAPSGGVQNGLPLFVNSTTDPRCKNYFVNVTPTTAQQVSTGLLCSCCGLSRIGKQPSSTSFQNLYVPGTAAACTDGGEKTMVHELGHVLGLYHEHQRWDRDAYVTVNTANIPAIRQPDYKPAFGKPNRLNGPYDLESVMHYDGGPNGAYMTLSNGTALPSWVGPKPFPTTGDAAAVISMYQWYQNRPPGATSDMTAHDAQGAVIGGAVNAVASSAAAGGNNDYQVVAVTGTDQAVWYNTLPASGLCNGWCGWASIGGVVTSPPGLVVSTGAPTGDPGIFAIGGDQQTMCMWGMRLGPYDGGWTCDGSPTAWGGPMVSDYRLSISSAPAVAYRDGSWIINAAATDTSGTTGIVENVLFPDGTWDGWSLPLASGVAVSTGPALVYESWGDVICTFYVGEDGGIHSLGWDCYQFPDGTKPPPGIMFDTSVTGTSRGPGQIELFVMAGDGLIWGIDRYGGWNAWKVYGGPANDARPSTPAVAPFSLGWNNTGPVNLFFKTKDPPLLPNVTFFDPSNRYDDLWAMTVTPSQLSL